MRMYTLIILTVCSLSVFAQINVQWGNLKQGPHAIGYKVLQMVDPTRHYFDDGRPLQVYVWYPAEKGRIDQYMKYGDYFEDASHEWGNDPERVNYLSNYFTKGYKSGALNPSFPQPIPDAQFQKIIQTTIPAIRNGIPADGKFPVLLHAHVNGVLYQSVMMEYLASHGYVVVSISRYNSSPAHYGRGEEGPHAMQALTEDVAQALWQAQELTNADTQQVAMIGMNADVGVSLQMRGMPLKAILCTDCGWLWGYGELFNKLPYYDTKKMRIPIMELANTEMGPPERYLDSLIYAGRYSGTFKKFTHGDFYPYPKIAKPEESKKITNHESMIISMLQFLDATLKNSEQGKNFLQSPASLKDFPTDFLSIQYTPAQKSVPTEGEFLTWLRYGEMDKVDDAWRNGGKKLVDQNTLFFAVLFLAVDNEPHALEALTRYVKAFPDDMRTQMIFSRLGTGLLQAKQIDKAVASYELYTQKFPQSPQAFHGLSEAYELAGEKTKSVQAAKNVLELLEKVQLDPKEKEWLRIQAEKRSSLPLKQ